MLLCNRTSPFRWHLVKLELLFLSMFSQHRSTFIWRGFGRFHIFFSLAKAICRCLRLLLLLGSQCQLWILLSGCYDLLPQGRQVREGHLHGAVHAEQQCPVTFQVLVGQLAEDGVLLDVPILE